MKYTAVLAGLLLSLLTACGPKEIKISIIETSDVHGCIFPEDLIRDKELEHSLAHVYSYVESLRKLGNEVILLDNGDILQGQPTVYYSNYIDTAGPHICSEVMNFMGYDAATVGNHDIEAGHKVYDKLRKEFDFPWLAANAVDVKTGEPYFQPYKVIERKGVKIVVFGLITPGIPHWLPRELWEGIEFKDMVETAKEWVPRILKQEDPDILVGLFHSGHDATYGGASALDSLNENASLLVAEQVPGFDIIFMGHDHDVYSEKVKSTDGSTVHLLDPGSRARNIAQADICYSYEKKGRKKSFTKRISSYTLEPGSMSATGAYTEEFLDAFAPGLRELKDYVSGEVGEISRGLSASIALFGDNAFTDLIHRVQLDVSGADISFTAPLSMYARIDSGKLFVRDMFELYRFENYLYTMQLRGNEIDDYLEYSYGLWFRTMSSGKDTLLNLNNRAYNFDSAEGIEYMVDISRPAGDRVTILSMTDGTPFDPGKDYKVAINSYRGNGGGGHLTAGVGLDADEMESRRISSTTRDLRFYMMEWIENNSPLDIKENNNWKVFPLIWWEEASTREYNSLFNKE